MHEQTYYNIETASAQADRGNERRHCLTDEIYKKLYKRPRVAAILRDLFEAGMDGKVMSIAEIATVGNCTKPTAKKIAQDYCTFVPPAVSESTSEQLVKSLTPSVKRKKVSSSLLIPKRGRRACLFARIPTLRELERKLKCSPKHRRYTIDFDTADELKQQTAGDVVKRKKEGEFSNAYLAKASGMSVNTVKKHIKAVAEITEQTEVHQLTIEEMANLPDTHEDYKANRKKGSWAYIRVGKSSFGYYKKGARLAVEANNDFLEGIEVVTQRAHYYRYTAWKTEVREVRKSYPVPDYASETEITADQLQSFCTAPDETPEEIQLPPEIPCGVELTNAEKILAKKYGSIYARQTIQLMEVSNV